ncbi:ABC transporter permease subunit [Polymorphospora lycopeni]|uniref:ABC transporter permease subunit n=1 Tax=Polymorphospora lycopeni TaxID=3140240 RepID=A0ABV5CTX7_9ACTN
MSLAKAEFRRLFKRRVTRLMLVLMVLGLGAIVVSFSLASQPTGPAQRAAAEAKAQQQYEEQVRYHQESVADCEAAQARGENTDDRYPPDCGRDYAPQRDQFMAEWFLPYQFDFKAEFGIFVSVFAGIVALFGFIVGASYVGAEWNTGGMMNLLLWRPRRLPVLLTKLGVLLGSVLGISVVLGALWTVAFWLIGKFDGTVAGMTGGTWQSLAITGARGIGLVLAVTAVAFGLASLGRHTAMALGAAVGIGVVSEIGLRIALNIVGVSFPDRFVLSSYAVAWFNKSYTLFDWNSCQFTMGACEPAEWVVTWQQSAVLFGVGLVAVLGAALWTMRSRDIT